jgi:hypothetical protein
VIQLLRNINTSSLAINSTPTFARLWRWSDKKDDHLKAFSLSNKRVYLFLLQQDFNHNRLNATWEAQMDESEWRLFWNAL